MKTFVVVGIGYGDEGKGLTTDYLSGRNGDSLVVRYNGGHQAGHTVCTTNDKRHVFSNFGSGTLCGAPTFWSRFCTISPPAIVREWGVLKTKVFGPINLMIDPLCPVTTPYDIKRNQNLEDCRMLKHGSCGIGFGTTIQRHEGSPYRLHAQDLLYPELTEMKLRSIRDYYQMEYSDQEGIFLDSLELFSKHTHLITEEEVFGFPYDNIVFEGAQGVMLDMDFGVFPHVTRSNTTSKNALEIIRRNGLRDPQIFYVTRAYQTRHGAGPMTNQRYPVQLINNSEETNRDNRWQGDFRSGILDVSLLQYAIMCDNNFSSGLIKNLVITCLDQLVDNTISYTIKGNILKATSPEQLRDVVCSGAPLYKSMSPYAEKIITP